MGAWAVGTFANDTALDWLGDFLDGEDEEPIYAALEGVIHEHDVGDGGEQALAAAETVALLLGRPCARAPDDLIAWAKQAEGTIDPELPALAIRAVRRIRDASELRELWFEGDQGDAWLVEVDDLLARLARGPFTPS